MKLEHFGMAEPGDCRLVFTADAEELERAITAEQAVPDAPQAEEALADGGSEPHHPGGLFGPV